MYTTSTYADRRWRSAETREGCVLPWATNQGSNYGPCVSIYAPAWNIRVAGASGATSYRTPGGASSGTSFAAPAVAGAVARLLHRYPTLSATQVWTELVNRAGQRVNIPDFDPTTATFNNRLLYLSPFD